MHGQGLRVVLVLPTYLPETFGGAEQQTRRLAQGLAEHGVAVTILAPRLRRRTPARADEGEVRVRRLLMPAAPNLGGRHMLAFLFWCVSASSWLARHRRTYDVVHVIHGRLHAVPAALAAPRLRKPLVVKPGRGGAAHFDLAAVRSKRLVGRLAARTIVAATDAWIANSIEIASDLRDWGVPEQQIHAIPNGVPAVEPADDARPGGAVRFLSVGRLDTEKAVERTITAFAALPPTTDATLDILGDGPCRTALEALSRSLGQDARIRFLGAVDDVRPHLRQADVYVSTSVSEGMSNALLEAMSFGVVPVVSCVSGVADLIVAGDTGLIFPVGDDAAATECLLEALTQPAAERDRMGRAAQSLVRTRFSMGAVISAHIELYRTLKVHGR